jgi:hypothetical protein
MHCRNVILGLNLSESEISQISVHANTTNQAACVAHRPSELMSLLCEMWVWDAGQRLFVVNFGLEAVCGVSFVNMLRDLELPGHTHLYGVFPKSEDPEVTVELNRTSSSCQCQSPVRRALSRYAFAWEELDHLVDKRLAYNPPNVFRLGLSRPFAASPLVARVA